MKEKETNRNRFIRLATLRTNTVLKRLKVLGNCANRSVYEYTEQDINKEIELTGDRTTFMEKRLLLHESQGEYEQASALAGELGKPELAEKYKQMHQMVASGKA